MKRAELKNIIKEELQLIKEDKKTEKDIKDYVGAYLSDAINKTFQQFVTSKQVDAGIKIDNKQSPGARRQTTDTVQFWIHPKDLKKSLINVELVINVKMRETGN